MKQILEFAQNHWELVAGLVAIVALLIFEEFRHQLRGIKKIKPEVATNLMNHQNAVVVDLREQQQFYSGHIIGSISAPKSELEKNFDQLTSYKNKIIILVDQNGTSSVNLAPKLVKAGFKEVTVLSQGIASWKNANLPLTKK